MKINKKKAFTIVEIVTTLAVASIIVGLALGLVVAIVGINKRQQNSIDCRAEYQDACIFVDDFINNYNISGYSIKSVTTQNGIATIKITDNINEYSLTYSKVTNLITAELFSQLTGEVTTLQKTLTKTSNIVFTNQENLIKCEFEFEDISPLTKLFTFGVI